MFSRILVLILILSIRPTPELTSASSADVCEYDLNLTGNKVKIVCQGTPSTINVHAENAKLQTRHVDKNSGESWQNQPATSTATKKPPDLPWNSGQQGVTRKAPDFLSWNSDSGTWQQGVTRKSPDFLSWNSNSGTRQQEVTRKSPDFLSWNSDSRTWQPGTVSNEMTNQGSDFNPSERLTLNEHHVFEESLTETDLLRLQKNWHELATKHKGRFAEVVWDSSQRLDRTRQSLSTSTESLRNISLQLVEEGFNHRPHMESLRMIGNSATDLKEGIIMAMRNQYNFMSTALLTRNYELEKLASSMSVLMDIVTEAFQSALVAQKTVGEKLSIANSTLLTMRKRVARELSRYESLQVRKGVHTGMKEQCPKQISAIGSGRFKSAQWSNGSYMVDPVGRGGRRPVYIMAGPSPSDQIRKYNTALDVDYDLLGSYLQLPFFCSGMSHVVYRNHFYCHKSGTRLIVKYHLKRMSTVSELALPRAKFGNMESLSFTHIDLAVDELGLWAIYSTEDSEGNITVTKIDSQKMEIQQTWSTNFPLQQSGNSFMICGVLYVTNSRIDTPTFIQYTYDTNTNKEQLLEDGVLPFANSAFLGSHDRSDKRISEKSANSVMLSYDFRTALLYSWNSGRIEWFPVYFSLLDTDG